MHNFCLLLHSFFLSIYVHLWHVASVRFGTAKYTRGLSSPNYGVISPNTFKSAIPRTYSIICNGSESCLGTIVGFARLPCFGTLRSVISAKVALGEPLRFCPSWARWAPQWRKLKLTVMMGESRTLFERFFRDPKDLCHFERGTGFVRPRSG